MVFKTDMEYTFGYTFWVGVIFKINESPNVWGHGLLDENSVVLANLDKSSRLKCAVNL